MTTASTEPEMVIWKDGVLEINVHDAHDASEGRPRDITDDLPRIQCPTLVMTTEASALGSIESTRVWQKTIPNSELCVIPGDSYHLAATDADVCAEETLKFIRKNREKP